MSAEMDVVSKLRLPMLETQTCDREPLGCSSILTGDEKNKASTSGQRIEKIHFESLTCRTVSDVLKVSGLNEIWLHHFEPPKELSNEDHHIFLLKTET